MIQVSPNIYRQHSPINITEREQEVLYLIAHECTTIQVAQKLFISEHTAITHRKRLLVKMDVKNTAGLVRRGFELGYLSLATRH